MTPDELRSRLDSYLASRSRDHSRCSLGPLVPLTGGWASTLFTVALQYTDQHAEPGGASSTPLVLKLYAPTASGCEHAALEWQALRQLRAVGYAVPDVVHYEPDALHLGCPFIVMEHIAGTSFWPVYEAADLEARTELTRSFVAQLVELHDLDPRLLEPAGSPAGPYSAIGRELEQLRADAATSQHAPLAEVVLWLKHHRRAVSWSRSVILHRDYHPWNVVVDRARCLWVLDWDWRIGDPRFDVAWTCTLMQRSGFDAFSSSVRADYERLSGHRLEDFAYFEVLTTVRWLLNVLPSVEPGGALSAEAAAEFRVFLVEPVRRAQTLLHEHTGITVDMRM